MDVASTICTLRDVGTLDCICLTQNPPDPAHPLSVFINIQFPVVNIYLGMLTVVAELTCASGHEFWRVGCCSSPSAKLIPGANGGRGSGSYAAQDLAGLVPTLFYGAL